MLCYSDFGIFVVSRHSLESKQKGRGSSLLPEARKGVQEGLDLIGQITRRQQPYLEPLSSQTNIKVRIPLDLNSEI